MTTLRVLTAVLVLVGACSATTEAQTSRNPAAFPRVFGGVGFETLTNDVPRTDPHTTFALELVPVSAALHIEGGAAVAARLSGGIEFVRPPKIDVTTQFIVGTSTMHRDEKLVLGVVRGRLVAAQFIAVDAVVGIGAIFPDYRLRNESCRVTGPGCNLIRDERLNQPSRALVVGVDAPFQIVNHVNHVWVIPELRFYHAPAPYLTNGGRWRLPDRKAIGITGRVGW